MKYFLTALIILIANLTVSSYAQSANHANPVRQHLQANETRAAHAAAAAPPTAPATAANNSASSTAAAAQWRARQQRPHAPDNSHECLDGKIVVARNNPHACDSHGGMRSQD